MVTTQNTLEKNARKLIFFVSVNKELGRTLFVRCLLNRTPQNITYFWDCLIFFWPRSSLHSTFCRPSVHQARSECWCGSSIFRPFNIFAIFSTVQMKEIKKIVFSWCYVHCVLETPYSFFVECFSHLSAFQSECFSCYVVCSLTLFAPSAARGRTKFRPLWELTAQKESRRNWAILFCGIFSCYSVASVC